MPRTGARPRAGWASGLFVFTLVTGLVGSSPAHALGGGSPAAENTYRFVAKLDIGGSRSCSGVLIDPQWVITASTCFAEGSQPLSVGPPRQATTATIGRPHLTRTTGQVVKVVQLVPHADRNLVMARLAAPVTDIPPVQIGITPPAPGEVLRLAGYGRTTTEWVPDQLHTATFSVQNVTGTTLELAGQAPANASTCKGDAGGPAFRESSGRIELVALHSTSWQHGCLGETEARQGVTETRVDDLTAWIQQQILDALPTTTPAMGLTLAAAHSGLCLHVRGASQADSAAVVQYTCTSSGLNERWRAVPAGDGSYQLVALHSGKCLNVKGASRADSAAVIQYKCTSNGLNDRWRLRAVPGTANRFQLIAMHSGKCLNVSGARKASSVPVIQYRCTNAASALNEQWFLRPATAAQPAVPVEPFSPTSALQATSAVGATAGALTYVYVENDGRLLHGHQADPDNPNTLRWTVISGSNKFSGQPELIRLADGRLQVVAHHTNSEVYLRIQNNLSAPGWGDWLAMGGSSASHPTVERLPNGTSVLFTLAGGGLWHLQQRRNVAPFLGWQSLGGSGLVGTPTVVPIRDGLQIFALNAAGAVQTATYRNEALSRWTSLGGAGFTGAPSVVVYPDFSVRVFARTADGTIVTKRQSATGAFPTAWEAVGGFVAAGPPAAVINPKNGRTELVARAPDGMIYAVAETGQGTGAWSDWRPAVRAGLVSATDPSVVTFARSPGDMAWGFVFRTSSRESYLVTSQPGADPATTGPSAFTIQKLPTPPAS